MASATMPAMAGWRATHLVCCPAKIERTAAGVVQQSIQCHKGPSGTACGYPEGSIRRQTAVQTPREQERKERQAGQGVGCEPGSVLPIAPKREHFYVHRLELNREAQDSRE